MKRKDALRRHYDNDIFRELIRRFVHLEQDRAMLTDYFCNGKSIMEISKIYDVSTRHVWDVKDEYEGYLFKIYEEHTK